MFSEESNFNITIIHTSTYAIDEIKNNNHLGGFPTKYLEQ